MKIQHFFDAATSTLSYVVYKQDQGFAVVIDPVWDFDLASGRLSDGSVSAIVEYLQEHKLAVSHIIETHVHADHLSGAQILKSQFPEARLVINARITKVQEFFKSVYNMKEDLPVDGSQFDYLVEDFETFAAAGLQIKAIPTPGHTPICTSFLVEDAVFTGDAMFMPDFGTGRCDFPSGSAKDLYLAITEQLYKLPDATRVFVGHDYQPGGRDLKFETTIGEQKRDNIQLKSSATLEEFVSFREKRDAVLSAPKLLYPSLQVNIRGGRIPREEDNGISYLKIPLKTSE